MANITDLAPLALPDPTEWNGYSAAPCAAVGLGLAVIAVALRFWARAGIIRVTGVEDWFILTSLGFSVAITACLGLRTFTLLTRNYQQTFSGMELTTTTLGRATQWTGETRDIR
jgi:hypothetical protein